MHYGGQALRSFLPAPWCQCSTFLHIVGDYVYQATVFRLSSNGTVQFLRMIVLTGFLMWVLDSIMMRGLEGIISKFIPVACLQFVSHPIVQVGLLLPLCRYCLEFNLYHHLLFSDFKTNIAATGSAIGVFEKGAGGSFLQTSAAAGAS